jgi:hypothetical protein
VTITPVVGTTMPLGIDVELVIVEGTVITTPGDTGFSVESLGIGRLGNPGMEVVGPMPMPGAGPALRVGTAELVLTPRDADGDTVVVVVVVVDVTAAP